NKPRSPRQVLQYWGTEYRRTVDSDDYWRSQVDSYIRAHPGTAFVITDVRFPDEGKLVESYPNGRLARILRPGIKVTDQHASEKAMVEYPIELVFTNNEGKAGMTDFRNQVLEAFTQVMHVD